MLYLMTRQPFRGFGGGSGSQAQLLVQAWDFIRELNEATRQLPERGWAMAEIQVEIVPAGG